MTVEKDKLLNSLFGRSDQEVLNIKFCRGAGTDVSLEAFCTEVSRVLFAIETGRTDSSELFREHSQPLDVKEFVKRFA